MGRDLRLTGVRGRGRVGAQASPDIMADITEVSSRMLTWPAVLRKLDRIDPSYKQ